VSAPRLEVDLTKIGHNARTLVNRLAGRGIGVTGVTKAMLGAPELARVLVDAGVRSIGDARIDNLETMRRAGIDARMVLIRSPMISQAARVVATADASLNTEPDVLASLSEAALAIGMTHEVVLMVELGDLREGILPNDLDAVVAGLLRLRGLRFVGLGTNLACRSGVVPDVTKMAELSALTRHVEQVFGIDLQVVSGGNSANLDGALGTDEVGRVNDLRLGESILLGREPLHRRAIPGLYADAITVLAEVIESKRKPSVPWGTIAQGAFGEVDTVADRGLIMQSILAIGRQDVDPDGLDPPPDTDILSASSDHLVIGTPELLPIGSTVAFAPNYSSLLRAMTSPFVMTVWRHDHSIGSSNGSSGSSSSSASSPSSGR
jgi:ornithine racemase